MIVMPMPPNPFPALSFVAAAAVAAWWSARASPKAWGVIRLASSLVVAAAVAFPAPVALLAGLAAVLAGRGLGLSGWARAGGPAAMAAEFAGVLAGVGAVRAAAGAPAPALAVIAFLALSGITALASGLADRPDAPWNGRRLAYESANPGIAIVLADQVLREGRGSTLVTIVLVLLANHALATLARVLSTLRDSNEALAARVTELATLHAIGGEILSTLDPERVFSIVDRECRKIFDVDFFFIGVLDRDTSQIRISYRAERGEVTRETTTPLEEGLASWIVREKRAVRIDDATEGRLPFRPQIVDKEIRSILAVPLIVDDQVVGVLSVQSRKLQAYDEHQLSVLSTIAQQAAVAVENARHYAMATVDSLTGLYLRDYFFRRLGEERARAQRYGGAFAVLMLDLDGLKEINDRQGHLAGDRYLRAFGATLKGRLRGADLGCRYGGDEFCILLPETDLAGAQPIAERIRGAVAGLVVDVPGSSVRATVSIGIASFPEHDSGELKGLMLRADQALYRAKRAGRDRVVAFA
jgi:diguanylate cyclase (GGDEF)-like protein